MINFHSFENKIMSVGKNTLLNKFQEFNSEKKLILRDEKTLLTVSGGLDSTVMTHLFSKSNFDFGIAHCNFSLRGNESDGDAEFVNSLAAKYNKPFHLKKFNTQQFADENKYSIQEAARILRYKWFEELSEEFKYERIATAHHLDDSIETFFINLLRGTGTAGLKGISVKKGKVIRPLLFATRMEIEKYSSENKLNYREDSSNDKDDYLRNRIRHHIIPVIKENSEGFEANMENLMENFSLINDLVNEKMADWKKNHVRADEEGNLRIPLEKILKEDKPESFLSLLLHSEGMTGVDCRKILLAKSSGKIFNGRNHTLLFDRGFLVLRKNDTIEPKTFNISELPAEIHSEKMIIHLSEEGRKEKDGVSDEKNILKIDGEKISLPLVLRTWKPGDYFFPLGMKGKKKISDFYTDEKINRFQKDNIYLLLSGKDIVCILGHRIDDRYKITPTTKKILTIEFSLK